MLLPKYVYRAVVPKLPHFHNVLLIASFFSRVLLPLLFTYMWFGEVCSRLAPQFCTQHSNDLISEKRAINSSFQTFMNRNCRAVRFWINSFPSARNGVIRSLMRREECSSRTRTRNWTEGGEKYRLRFHVKFRSPAEFLLGFFLSYFM